MMSKITKQKIISRVKKETGVKIDMFRQSFSWVMFYDDPDNHAYYTRTVYVMWLSHMSLGRWVKEGVDFVNCIKKGEQND